MISFSRAIASSILKLFGIRERVHLISPCKSIASAVAMVSDAILEIVGDALGMTPILASTTVPQPNRRR